MSEHEHLVVEEYKLCFVITSDAVYRGEKPDKIKDLVPRILEYCSGAKLASYVVVPNDAEEISRSVLEAIDVCDVVIVTGGTGISRRDITIDVVSKLADKELKGFGELFRYLSYEEIGARAMLSRASAYIVKDALVFVLPGNPKAIELAFSKLICDSVKHAVYELKYRK